MLKSQNNRQNLHRRSTVARIPTEQAESSTESEEEDDRVLDGKVVSPLYTRPAVLDLPNYVVFLLPYLSGYFCWKSEIRVGLTENQNKLQFITTVQTFYSKTTLYPYSDWCAFNPMQNAMSHIAHLHGLAKTWRMRMAWSGLCLIFLSFFFFFSSCRV